MSKRFKICLSLWFAVLAVSLCSGQTFAQESVPPLPSTDADDSVLLFPAPLPVLNEGSEVGPPPIAPPPIAPIPMIADEDWAIQITPALKLKSKTMLPGMPALEHPEEGQHEEAHQPMMSQEQFASEYQRVYDSIPFNRAEYNRNPTYRHDSAMEILTGNARHQTIVKHQPQQIERPAVQSPRLNPSRFGSSRFGSSRFGSFRPARPSIYRYFPIQNPFLNGVNLLGAPGNDLVR